MALTESLTFRSARAVQWRFAGVAVGAVSQFAISVVLARLLTPADFGVVALASVVLGVIRPFANVGVGPALVQRTDVTALHIRTAFTFSVVVGLTVTMAIMAVAPLAAVVMQNPDVTPVLRWLSTGFAFRSAATTANAILQRQLDFKRQSVIETASNLLGYGAVAIVMALLGYGVWSLVWGGLVQTLLASIAQLVVARHSLRPAFARRELGELLHFGFGSTVNACVGYVALNVDNFVVGRWIGAASLGLYSRAYSLMNLPHTFFASVMMNVLFPAFSQVQGDPARLGRAYLLVTQLTAMVAAPAMGTLAIAAPHLVQSVYGPQWAGAVIPLQILCGVGYFRAVYHVGGVVVRSVGWMYSWLLRQAIYASLVFAGALIGSRYGLPGVAMGVSVAIIYMFVATAQLAMRATATSWDVYIRAQLSALIAAGTTCGVALSVRLLLEAWQLSSTTIALAAVTAAVIPWGIGVFRILGKPEFEPLRSHMPAFFVRVSRALRPSASPSR